MPPELFSRLTDPQTSVCLHEKTWPAMVGATMFTESYQNVGLPFAQSGRKGLIASEVGPRAERVNCR